MLRRLAITNLVLIRAAELELDPGLNVISGETGAGKTILANAIGLLLGARGDAAQIGSAAREAYVEAEFDDAGDDALGPLADLRPADEEGLLLARRIFPDGRARAYAWGRSAASEDVASAAEALLAMSGQFEQRRLASRGYRLGLLDAFCGVELAAGRAAWRALQAARRAHDELARDAAGVRGRLAELRLLVDDTTGLTPDGEQELRGERERLRHLSQLVEGVGAAVLALAGDDGDGAADLTAAAGNALAPLEHLAPDLASANAILAGAELQLRETASELRRFLVSLEAEPGRLAQVDAELDRLADLRRRYHAATFAELLARAEDARAELAAADAGHDPVAAAEAALVAAEAAVARLHAEYREARGRAAEPFATAVAGELRGLGLGDGEFRVELAEREPGPSGADEVAFLIRPNAGLPFAPVAETASGGELSRIALALAAVGGGETLVFDEIDAGIGGSTAHAVAETLRRLAARSQVITITHLPQIAAVADRHFGVEKVPGDPTHTAIELLDEQGRRAELERMLGGAEFLASLER